MNGDSATPEQANAENLSAEQTSIAPGPLEQHELEESEERPAQPDVDRLQVVMNIPVNLSVELGRTRMSIRDLLQLTRGSVVKLDQPAGEPLDLLVNGCLVARGEVVVVNERYGVRITDIVSAEERIKRV